MGWLYSTAWPTRRALIEHLTEDHVYWDYPKREFRTLKHCLRGNVLWLVSRWVVEGEEQPAVITCCLMQNGGQHGWGYKDMDESMGPFYYSCPLSYLDLAPEADPEWRAAVRNYHSQRVGDSQ